MHRAPGNPEILDCLVVGAGPGGLTAALYLKRFGRHIVLVDAGNSRARFIDRCHNFPGFSDGVAGEELLDNMHRQLQKAGGCVLQGEVTELLQAPHETGFLACVSGREVRARTVLLATGTVDALPSVPGVGQLWRSGLLRQCPICDGPENRDKHIAVIGDGEHAQREADFLAHFSDRVEWLGTQPASEWAPDAGGRVQRHALEVDQVRAHEGGIEVRLHGGTDLQFDVAYAAVGTQPQAGLAISLGARHDENGAVEIDAHCRTSVSRLFAAGDVTSGLSQLVVAASHGAIAATAVHNACRAIDASAADASQRTGIWRAGQVA